MAEDPTSGLRILVTNDDGINAPGIRTLEQVARRLSEDVWVVAPETNQSGAAHSLTLQRPLRIRRLSERRFAVDGTPTDCVLVALQRLVEESVDLVLSGVNRGGNLAEDISYSGTVAAAIEATLFKIRAIAFSQVHQSRESVRWATAEHVAPDLVRRLIALDWSPEVLINVNVPDVPPDAVRGVRITRQGKRKIGDVLVERIDPRGEPYLWIGALREESEQRPGSDLEAIEEGYVSVTPIQLDMTHHASFESLKAHLRE